MDRKFIGAVARVMDSSEHDLIICGERQIGVVPALIHPSPVPVARAADYAKAGAGRIFLSESDPLLVTGKDTQFTSQIKPQCQLVLPKSAGYASAQIKEVVSDTELRLKAEFVVPSKDGSANVKASTRVRTEGEVKEGLQYKVLPHVDQEQTYGAVFQRLNEGGSIGIFPEGERGWSRRRKPKSYQCHALTAPTPQAARTIGPTSSPSKPVSPSWHSAQWPPTQTST